MRFIFVMPASLPLWRIRRLVRLYRPNVMQFAFRYYQEESIQ